MADRESPPSRSKPFEKFPPEAVANGTSNPRCAISVGGEDLRSSTRSGGGAFWEEFSMRRWASQHPPGTSLSIRYDPQHPGNIVPDAGTMPGSEPQAEQDLGLTVPFMFLSAACMTVGRVLQSRREESNTLNRDNTNE